MADFVDPVANQENLVQEQQNVVSQRQTDLQTVETRLRQGYDFVGLSENDINNKIQEIKQAGESFNSSNATEMEYKNIYQALVTAQDELESLQTELNGLNEEVHLLGDASLANLALRIDNLTTKVDNIQEGVDTRLARFKTKLIQKVDNIQEGVNITLARIEENIDNKLATIQSFVRQELTTKVDNIQTFVRQELTTKVDTIQTFVRQELSNQPNPLVLGVALVTATENGDVQRVGELLASPYLSTFINFKRATDGSCAIDIASQQGNPEIIRLLYCTPFTGKISLNDLNTDINESNWFDIIQNESVSKGELQYALFVNPDLINKCNSGYNALHYAARDNKKDTKLIELLLTNMSLTSINKKTSGGFTPLDRAYSNNSPIKQKIINLIRSKGGKRANER
eukprot:g9985.t1